MNEALVNLLMAIVFLVLGLILGMNMYNDCLLAEIEQYNSIRLNGVYYYPEEVIE